MKLNKKFSYARSWITINYFYTKNDIIYYNKNYNIYLSTLIYNQYFIDYMLQYNNINCLKINFLSNKINFKEVSWDEFDIDLFIDSINDHFYGDRIKLINVLNSDNKLEKLLAIKNSLSNMILFKKYNEDGHCTLKYLLKDQLNEIK